MTRDLPPGPPEGPEPAQPPAGPGEPPAAEETEAGSIEPASGPVESSAAAAQPPGPSAEPADGDGEVPAEPVEPVAGVGEAAGPGEPAVPAEPPAGAETEGGSTAPPGGSAEPPAAAAQPSGPSAEPAGRGGEAPAEPVAPPPEGQAGPVAPTGPAGPPTASAEPPAAAAPPRARRFWSRRRVPSAITAVLVLAVAGPLLYDIAAVRAGRPAFAWRKRLADELATRPLDDGWVIAGAAVAAVLGLWLLVLALTPGLRAVLPMRRDTPGVRAGLDRHAAELALRDRAMEVSGVRAAQVTVSRRRALVRAEAHFRETEEVRTELDAVLTDGMAQLGLDRPPPITLRLRRGTG